MNQNVNVPPQYRGKFITAIGGFAQFGNPHEIGTPECDSKEIISDAGGSVDAETYFAKGGGESHLESGIERGYVRIDDVRPTANELDALAHGYETKSGIASVRESTIAFVAVMLGSDSDLKVMQATLDTLDSLGIRHELRILSAHRTPDEVREYLSDSGARGCAVYIAAAGLAAHLAGTVAAHTLKPVIGVPLDAGTLGGMDALLSTVQMPGGVPVACVAVGSPGAKNAAFLAARIIALSDPDTAQALKKYRDDNRASVLAKNKNL